ncbi:hypothetical protein [Merismopedia glauca]|uniref:Uncharacterized protein n=1 Tax=Merismopedia glauca CCAP 1448/3 TaxID=1296344 RepID=A0A2T1BZF2_9CYAN|nr:hypothetical protein [Merismopedia glauca]PSB01372.1 hypothetical protein C7B64_18725 [Merismopedia glauca CCAP 1448/3]
MTQPLKNRPRRRGRVFPEYNLPPSELARRQAEIDDFGLRCQTIWLHVSPELIEDHYNWFIMIEPESGDYFLDPDEMVAYQKARQKYPSGKLGTFRLNETGACGFI